MLTDIRLFLRILTSCRMSIAAVVSNIDCFIVVKSKYCYLPPAAILSLKFRKQHIVSVSCIPLLFSNSSFFPNNGANIFHVLSTRLKRVHWYLSCYLSQPLLQLLQESQMVLSPRPWRCERAVRLPDRITPI
jgi:hypothetical protein